VRPTPMQRARARARDVLQLLRFLGRHRSFWLALVVALLLVLSLVTYLVQTATIAPYVYPLF
jgi:hypothetical protein